MPISFACPSCNTRMSASESFAGKAVRCKHCSAAMTVPIPEAEVLEREAPTPRRAAVAKAVPSRSSRDDESDVDDRPVRKKSKKKKGPPVLLLAGIGGGVLLLLIAAGMGYLFLIGKVPALGGGGGFLGPKAPPGFSTVGESACGAQVYLPGQAQGQYVKHFGPGVDGVANPNSYAARNSDDDAVFVAARTTGFTPLTSEVELMKLFDKTQFITKPNKYDITNKKATAVSGHPGLQFTLIEKPDLWDDTAQKAEFFKDKNEEEKARVAKERKHMIIIVTTNEEWIYVIGIAKTMADPDAETLKTVLESVKFY